MAIPWRTGAVVPKLMVISTSLPGTRHGGGVIQDAILQGYPRDRYVCVSLRPPDWETMGGNTPASLAGVPCLVAPVTPEPRWRGARFYLPVVRAWGFFLAAPWRVRQAVAFGKRHGVDLVWGEFQGEALLLAAGVAAGLKAPLVGTIWDDPEGWLADARYDCLSRRLLLLRFREALHAARQVSTVSEAMQADYRRRYGLKSVILRYGHDLEDAVGEAQNSNPENTVVGFAGTVYGEDAWRSFLAACVRINAAGRLPPIKIRIFGNEGFPYPHPGVEVICEGWLPRQEMLRRLAAVDFCYLPYWFAPDKRRHAELSFPTKLTTYIAAGRPVLYHGPTWAFAHEVMQRWQVGAGAHSLDPEEISWVIIRVSLDEPLKKTFSLASRQAFEQEFNSGVMLGNFLKLISQEPPPHSINRQNPDRNATLCRHA
ncbi:MAG: glycosyltransferase [Desulfobaccales bacterium]